MNVPPIVIRLTGQPQTLPDGTVLVPCGMDYDGTIKPLTDLVVLPPDEPTVIEGK